ncbi:MAG: hypothetical protein ACKO45_00230 [Cyanobium sp.]
MTHPSILHPVGLLMAIAATLPLPLASTAAPANEVALRRAGDRLGQVWQQDPLTARQPFPAIRLVEAHSDSDCPSAPFGVTSPLLLACPVRGVIFVERSKLAALNGVFGEAAELFVVAYGLGQSLVSASPGPAPASQPVASAALRAACNAGTLLAAMPMPPAERRLLLNNAISAGEQAFPSSVSSHIGTGPQRAYALLSGMGGTSLDCGSAAMARLAGGAQPLEAFLATRGTSVGIDVFCRQPPACPRRLMVGVGGV